MRYFIYCRKSSEAEDRQVMSIVSQLSTLQRTFGDRSGVEIVGIYEEAFSAKAPGRARFDEMLARIERGHAEGVIAWAPDRLARNSIDGGRIIYMLDQTRLRDLKFATYTFENNSQGKFMLQIMFGQSKYYSDALSENVKRGNRTKIERGWRPNQAPLGYKNEPSTKTIVKDPMHFALIRQLFDLMLTGAFSPKQVARIARDEWGFRTIKRKRIGGGPLALSSIYKILSNPFYAGIIVWGGQLYPGKHEPLVSVDEFDRVQRLVRRPGSPRPQKHIFAFTGMIRCGACGLRVTAEHKTKRSGVRYIYYHCTRRQLDYPCKQASIEVRELERQVETFIRSLTIDAKIEEWAIEGLKNDDSRLAKGREAQKQSLEAALVGTEKQLSELTGLRVRDLISDAEFVARRAELQRERMSLNERLAAGDQPNDRFEPLSELISFSNRAADWFLQANDHTKRLILKTVGSNPTLQDKILSIEAVKPFIAAPKLAAFPHQLGVIDDVRTIRARKRWLKNLLKDIKETLATEQGRERFDNIRKIREMLSQSSFRRSLRAAPGQRLHYPTIFKDNGSVRSHPIPEHEERGGNPRGH